MESCVKNCGSIVHDEIATKAFMEEVREMIKHSKEESVKAKLLELLQTWGMAFRSNQKYRIVTVRPVQQQMYQLGSLIECCFSCLNCAGHFELDES